MTTIAIGVSVLLFHPEESLAAGTALPRFDAHRLALIDRVLAESIAAGEAPGAVVLVGDRRGVVFERAPGHRALEPRREPMTLDTVFDAASLTKPVVTATAIMQLVEDGRIGLNDTLASHIPECRVYGKAAITLRHLLTHTSGLRSGIDGTPEWRGPEEAVRRACDEVPLSPPDERVLYSDINYILLGEVVRRTSGQTLDHYARARIFTPLRMHDSGFAPVDVPPARLAPTEACRPLASCPSGGAMLRGEVHDPTARRMGGVAGHAGLFTTAADLARFARMMLNGGMLDGERVLSPLSVARMTGVATPAHERAKRGLGWDIDSNYSRNRGDLMMPGSFGHTGFTGPSIWIDPVADLFVIVLTSRLHPAGKGDVSVLRGRVATLAAAALVEAPSRATVRFGGELLAPLPPPTETTPDDGVLSGLDVLRAEGFRRLEGKRIGLVTNHTGRTREGESAIELLRRHPKLTLVALFSPEHGLHGMLDEKVASAVDGATGLMIHSLYGETRRPTSAMLEGIDVLVFDIQDIGARFYTYTSTLGLVMEAAAERNIDVMVLDRPNPLNGWQIEGPLLDKAQIGFTGYFPMPIRHGMTIGELATLLNEEKAIGARLSVVPMLAWARDDWFDMTGLPWVNPSPNMRNLLQAMLYPGIGAFEWANISVGRGTDSPFEQIGAPWIEGRALAEFLNRRKLPGIRFYPVHFTPTASQYKGQNCQGIFMVITDRHALRPVRVGLEIAHALRSLYPTHFEMGKTVALFGSAEGLQRLLKGDDPAAIAAAWAGDEARWRRLRARYLIYR